MRRATAGRVGADVADRLGVTDRHLRRIFVGRARRVADMPT
jgi:hypothetical protein